MIRSEADIRRELERYKQRVREARAAKQGIDAAYAMIIVGVLAYVLGEAPSPATRIKVE